MKQAIAYTYDETDTPVVFMERESDADWIKARRLLKSGTPEDIEELRRMEDTPLLIIEKEDMT